ncbi:MAG TPA: fructose-1,6-bisphosphate aldolase, class II [Firmicutes bacterium]|nr:fructose-1,6-bisphosphate aldolase, class II [Bacillota bacterium]HBS93678.1 fructose-1,6-bisphosphate aldolase, class II [Bacillota bacterium]HCX78187.1 fructose-1,6-bisphosphate aldolase, class II [Bacillota bacterium]
MALVPMSLLLKQAQKGGYAVGAFNANNLEIVQGIVEAANELDSPVILQASQGAIKYAGLDYIAAIVKIASEKVKVPVALHLDHGTSFEQAVQCIRAGFSAVMFDGSKHSFEDNIANTVAVVRVAKPAGVSVEAELGKIGGTEDDVSVSDKDAMMTVPEEAQEFVERTGIDALAVAIGTAHGPYKGEPRLDFARLQKIRDQVDVPLVLHGASGVPEDAIQKAISIGICKINIDTDLRQAFTAAIKQVLAEKPGEFDPRKLLGPGREALKQVAKQKIQLFGSAGQA